MMRVIIFAAILFLGGISISSAQQRDPPSVWELRKLKPGTEEYKNAIHLVYSAKSPVISLQSAIARVEAYEKKYKLRIMPKTFLSSVSYHTRNDSDSLRAFSGAFPVWVMTYSMNYNVKEITEYWYVSMDGTVSGVGIRQ